jgi:hypothetical protein
MMSFALTTEQVRNRTKTVTRRVGWRFAKVGDVVQPVVKAQGLKKGEHPQPIGGPIRFVAVDRERLYDIRYRDQDLFAERQQRDSVDRRDLESDDRLHEGVARLRALLHRADAGVPDQGPEVRQRRDRPAAARRPARAAAALAEAAAGVRQQPERSVSRRRAGRVHRSGVRGDGAGCRSTRFRC